MDHTKQKIIAEIVKCGKNPVYFINTYCKIQHPMKGMLPFKTYPFQDDCVNAFKENRFNVVLKSRQLGLSTITAAYCVWYALFKKDKNILVIATKLEVAMNFTQKVKVMLEGLPKWLMLAQYESTKQKVTFDNGSKIHAVPTSKDAGRSEALSLLIVDEAAFINFFDDIWTALKPTLTTGGSAIILSTPKGVGGQYYTIWQEAVTGVNGFNPIKLPWHVHPEHDQEWLDNETKGLSRRKIAQEYLCDFITSGETFLQPEELDKIKEMITPPIVREGPGLNVWIWNKPESGRKYVISADVSRGDSTDFSAFHIFDYYTGDCVAEFIGKIPPDKFGEFLHEYGKKYNDAVIAPENNTFGYFACSKLVELQYPRVYYSKCDTDIFSYQPQIDDTPGFNTNSKTRSQILAKLEENIRNNAVKFKSSRLYSQFQTFVWNKSKASAAKGAHDDLIMSAAIGSWLIQIKQENQSKDDELVMAILKSTSLVRKDISDSHIGQVLSTVRSVVSPNAQTFMPRRYGNFDQRYNVRWLL